MSRVFTRYRSIDWEVYDKGFFAGTSMLTSGANPYSEDSEFHDIWLRGFNQAIFEIGEL